jgi:hypothetical protein
VKEDGLKHFISTVRSLKRRTWSFEDRRDIELLGIGLRLLAEPDIKDVAKKERLYLGALIRPERRIWSDEWAGFMKDSDEVLRMIQQVKLADRIANIRDYRFFFEGDFTIPSDDAKTLELPRKTFEKTFDWFAPLLVNNPRNALTQSDTEIFYSAFDAALREFAAIDAEAKTQAQPLVLAAQAAQKRLPRAVRSNPFFQRSAALQLLAGARLTEIPRIQRELRSLESVFDAMGHSIGESTRRTARTPSSASFTTALSAI